MIASKLIIGSSVGRPQIEALVLLGIGANAKCNTDESSRRGGTFAPRRASHVHIYRPILQISALNDRNRWPRRCRLVHQPHGFAPTVGGHFHAHVARHELCSRIERALDHVSRRRGACRFASHRRLIGPQMREACPDAQAEDQSCEYRWNSDHLVSPLRETDPNAGGSLRCLVAAS